MWSVGGAAGQQKECNSTTSNYGDGDGDSNADDKEDNEEYTQCKLPQYCLGPQLHRSRWHKYCRTATKKATRHEDKQNTRSTFLVPMTLVLN